MKQKPNNIKRNIAWLRLAHNRQTYNGKWVALKDGELLGSADSLKELIEQVGQSEDVMCTKVY